MAEEPELEEYEELEEEQPVGDDAAANKGFVGIHSVSFDDMQLKRELLRAIQDAGFEHPSESTFISHRRLHLDRTSVGTDCSCRAKPPRPC